MSEGGSVKWKSLKQVTRTWSQKKNQTDPCAFIQKATKTVYVDDKKKY